MSLFNFAGIRFGSAKIPGFGESQSLLGNKFGYDILRYPIDIGSTDKGHYMVIHINEQRRTQFKNTPGPIGDLPTIYENRIQNNTPTLGSAVVSSGGGVKSLVDTIFGSGTTQGILNKIPNSILPSTTAFDLSYGFARTIQRTSDTIALYMPDTLAFTNQQSYSDVSIGGVIAALATGAASATDAIKNSNTGTEAAANVFQNLSPFVGAALGSQIGGDLFRVGFAAVTGLIQNPMIELIYTSPAFRTFRFEFMLYPRSETEAEEVQKIIDRLKFHQAPEIQKDTNGFFLIPPSEFDIKFYYNGVENPNIPKISTCVLESIDMDYAPNGFSAYESVGEPVPKLGRTGMPVAIRLGLNFKETEYLTKDNFASRARGNFATDLLNTFVKKVT